MNCKLCKADATHIAAQSEDQGVTVTFVPICADEVPGWNEGGDWDAPVFELGSRVPHGKTLGAAAHEKIATYEGRPIERVGYVWTRRRVLACPGCRAEEPNRIAKRLTREELLAMFVKGFELSDRSPAFCANCCAPINILG